MPNIRNIPVLILAGGKGTRLQSEVKDRAKPMADINGKPFMDLILDLYKEHKIYISVGFKKESIIDYYKDRYSYIVEDEPLGTGGAIKKAFKEIGCNKLIVVNGDTYTNIELKKLPNKVTINTVFQNDCTRYGHVSVEDDIVSFKEKGHKGEGFINSGVYILDKEVLDDCPNIFSLEEFLTSYKDIGVVEHISDFIDIGVPEDYKKAIKKYG